MHVNDILGGLQKVSYRRVRPGRVEVQLLCHEAELETATLFDEPIESILSRNPLSWSIPSIIERQAHIMSKCLCRLRSKLFFQQALNCRIVILPHDVRVIVDVRSWD